MLLDIQGNINQNIIYITNGGCEMKIILCTWGSMCEPGMIKAINNLKYTVTLFDKKYTDVNYDKKYFLALADFIQKHSDATCVLSLNYMPIVARACKPFKIPYLSLTADCPCSTLYSKTLEYPHNRVFLFDRLQTEKFFPRNPENIFHLPLATDTTSWDNLKISEFDYKTYGCDISFVGSLYSEVCKYNLIEHKLPEYMKGYIDGLMSAQQNVYGYYFIEDAITTQWAREFQEHAELSGVAEDYIDDIKGIVADTYIGYKCTEQERINTIKAISEIFNMDLWTLSDTSVLPKVNNRGPADSGTMMPVIFKCSKINLNMTNRAIRSGIPLRIFDILGCGGFLISNYQPEILELFTPDEDIVLYDSIPDLLAKIDFYLKHDDIRTQIAKNGYEKVKKYHTYENRLRYMLKTSGII